MAPKPRSLTPSPTLPAQGSDGSPTPAAAFEAQTRDEIWAPVAESEIRQRFTKVRGGKLKDAECRHSQCRLTITGSEGEVGKTIGDLEGTRGLHGYAKTILLTAPEKKSDGSIVLHAFAMFDR